MQAESIGLAVGDYITGVNGTPLTELLTDPKSTKEMALLMKGMVRPITLNINELAGPAVAKGVEAGGNTTKGVAAASKAASMFSGAAASVFSFGDLQQQQQDDEMPSPAPPAAVAQKEEPHSLAADEGGCSAQVEGRLTVGPNVYPEVWERLGYKSVDGQDGEEESGNEGGKSQAEPKKLKLPELVERLGATQQQVLEQWQQTQEELVEKREAHEKEWARAEENATKLVQMKDLMLQEKRACKQLEDKLQKSKATEGQTAEQAKVSNSVLGFCFVLALLSLAFVSLGLPLLASLCAGAAADDPFAYRC
jgi:hypothetical protein